MGPADRTNCLIKWKDSLCVNTWTSICVPGVTWWVTLNVSRSVILCPKLQEWEGTWRWWVWGEDPAGKLGSRRGLNKTGKCGSHWAGGGQEGPEGTGPAVRNGDVTRVNTMRESVSLIARCHVTFLPSLRQTQTQCRLGVWDLSCDSNCARKADQDSKGTDTTDHVQRRGDLH